jgi:hypothetical protein
MGHEWQCVDVRARDFGSDIVVPEAPALTPEGAQGRTIKDVAAYLLSPEVEGDELEAEDLPTEAEAAVPPWVLGLREAEGPDLGVVD